MKLKHVGIIVVSVLAMSSAAKTRRMRIHYSWQLLAA